MGQVGPRYHLGKLRPGHVTLPASITLILTRKSCHPVMAALEWGVPTSRGRACVRESLALCRQLSSQKEGEKETGLHMSGFSFQSQQLDRSLVSKGIEIKQKCYS